jgi:hypothetical protein
MDNVIVIGILAALALASELWLRRHEAKKRPAAQETSPAALRGGLSATGRPPSVSAN